MVTCLDGAVDINNIFGIASVSSQLNNRKQGRGEEHSRLLADIELLMEKFDKTKLDGDICICTFLKRNESITANAEMA